jgi:hypothetical protein
MFRAFYLSGVLCTYVQQILNLMNTSWISDTQNSLQILINYFWLYLRKTCSTIPVTVGQNPTVDCSAATGIRGKCKLIIIIIIIYPT